jgi:hypothetical protein
MQLCQPGSFEVRQQISLSVWLPGQQQPRPLLVWKLLGCRSGVYVFFVLQCSGMGRTLATSRVVVSAKHNPVLLLLHVHLHAS